MFGQFWRDKTGNMEEKGPPLPEVIPHLVCACYMRCSIYLCLMMCVSAPC